MAGAERWHRHSYEGLCGEGYRAKMRALKEQCAWRSLAARCAMREGRERTVECGRGVVARLMTESTEPTENADERRAAEALVAYLAELPERQLRGVQMGDFYDARGHKDVIQKCRVGSCKKGVTSLCRAFPTLLAYRYVDGDVLVMRAVDVRTSSNVTTRLASAIAMANDRDDEGQAALKAIDDMLAQLKLELGSMNKLKKEVEERGICLRNGRELGDGLRRALRSGAQPTVNRHLAKDYAFAKKCLIVL